MAHTETPETLAEMMNDEFGIDANGHDESQRTVVVDRDDSVVSVSGVEAIGERNGYFVFATDVSEITLVAREDCEWK